MFFLDSRSLATLSPGRARNVPRNFGGYHSLYCDAYLDLESSWLCYEVSQIYGSNCQRVCTAAALTSHQKRAKIAIRTSSWMSFYSSARAQPVQVLSARNLEGEVADFWGSTTPNISGMFVFSWLLVLMDAVTHWWSIYYTCALVCFIEDIFSHESSQWAQIPTRRTEWAWSRQAFISPTVSSW